LCANAFGTFGQLLPEILGSVPRADHQLLTGCAPMRKGPPDKTMRIPLSQIVAQDAVERQ
jgi:hypothetical protein